MGARVLVERSSPLGSVTVLASPAVPLRYAPGLSLNAPREPPPQLALFTDGEGMSAIQAHRDARAALAYLDYLSSAAGYRLVTHPRVLILGSGTGSEVLQARYHAAATIDAVELNPDVVQLVQETFGDYFGRPYSAPEVRLHIGEARLRCRHGCRVRSRADCAARRLRRLIGRTVRPVRELSLHGRGAAGLFATARARRRARHHALGHAAAARHLEVVRHGRARAGTQWCG